MCNHYRIAQTKEVLDLAQGMADRVELETWDSAGHAWPKAIMPVVYANGAERTLTGMRWGVVPWYHKPGETVRYVTNARDDALFSKSIWKNSAAERRLLIAADAFFEWAGPKGAKWEVQFRLKSQEPFFFAGVWSADPGQKDRGFAMVTGKPNELLAAIPHERMPIILAKQQAGAWLSGQFTPPEKVLDLCLPYPAEEMERVDPPSPPRHNGSLELALE